MKVRFADCRLDTDARQLFRGTREVHLSPKAFEALKLLVEIRPRALSKAELLEQVWPGVFVSDASLARVVTEIRQALGDASRPRGIVRTVHRYGYAFATDVEENEPHLTVTEAAGRPVCWLLCGRREFALADGEHVAGREPTVSVWLDSRRVSRRHARIVVTGDRAMVEDLGSKNGTFVRGVRISTPTALKPGDEVRMGPFILCFSVTGGPEPTESEAPV